MVRFVILLPYTRQVLHIGLHQFGIWKDRLSKQADVEVYPNEEPNSDRESGSTSDLALAKFIPSAIRHTSDGARKTSSYIEIWEGIKNYNFGIGLTDVELEWILGEVNDFIAKVNHLTPVATEL